MSELRANISDELAEKIHTIMEQTGLYQSRSDFVRRAVSNKIKDDLKIIQNSSEIFGDIEEYFDDELSGETEDPRGESS